MAKLVNGWIGLFIFFTTILSFIIEHPDIVRLKLFLGISSSNLLRSSSRWRGGESISLIVLIHTERSSR